jgi:hypothetical protein
MRLSTILALARLSLDALTLRIMHECVLKLLDFEGLPLASAMAPFHDLSLRLLSDLVSFYTWLNSSSQTTLRVSLMSPR